MRKHNIFLGLFAAAMLGACSNDFETTTTVDDTPAVLSVNAQLPITRAAINDTTFTEGDKVGLFLPAYGDTYINVPAEWGDKRLNTESIILGSTKTRVAAYYPYTADINPEFPVVAVNIAAQQNFLYGISDAEVNNKAPQANIQFKHALSLLRLNVTYKKDVTLTSVQLSGNKIYKQAVFSIDKETYQPSLTGIPEYEATEEAPLTIKPNSSSTAKTVTQDVLLTPDGERTIRLVFNYNNGKAFPFNVTLPALAMGQQYTLNVTIKEDPYNGHPYVDLGLRSGLLWATCNMGAAEATQIGDYTAWNENDAVKASWKGVWRMPTKADMQELLTQCDWKWENTGFRVSSLTNSNSIFLPAGGIKDNEGVLSNESKYGFYLTSDQEEGYVFELSFYNEFFGRAYYIGSVPMDYQCNIRPVAPKVQQ